MDGYKHPIDDKKVKFKRNIIASRNNRWRWVFIVTMISFILSAFLSYTSSDLLGSGANPVIALGLVLFFIFIAILFDIIGTAVTAADETPFHAMASRKMYGAKEAIMLIRNAEKVSSLTNDVIGDIGGVLSGVGSAYIILILSNTIAPFWTMAVSVVVTGIVASLTVGGKAFGKTIAIANSNYIVYKVGVILKFLHGRIKFITIKHKRKKD